MDIRQATREDAGQVAEIYNYYVTQTHHTFETEPVDESEMGSRIERSGSEYPFLVAEADGVVVGYAFAAQFKLRQAYEHSAEVSIYVRNDAKQKGIGTRLYDRLFDELAETLTHAYIAGIALPNDASIRFHEKLGFKKVAHFEEVGYKLGRWIDVGYWELLPDA
ncbi:MAG: N-acetyltransferase [Acidobacteria bacterium]|nr:MAG: N-acetyltransferase [Acidobacteriota bacterium]REK03908.1 MAG: N-acetyltransferase [Acidobacteriota bacterium]REK15070.1 MAG: N-acetyltransferase [Acidobacteriota bacterium]REK46160.1 MAG: N-acetyltransferase [Acidobacteriota bacterium]